MEETLKQCQYLWEEYKYRHDLIWQRIFRFTTAVVLISIIPYIQQDIVRLLGNWILVAPVLAISLATFVLRVIWNELELYGKIKKAYRRQQNKLLDDDLKHDLNRKSNFRLFVLSYMFMLVVLSLCNLYIVWQILIPGVMSSPVCPCP